jgi:hypothetical protein
VPQAGQFRLIGDWDLHPDSWSNAIGASCH